MSPRAFQTVLVAPMAPKERKDLESRVLAAAFKQSFQRGDTDGANLAHKQIYLLLKAGEADAAAAEDFHEADNGDNQEAEAQSAAAERAGTREINLGGADYAKLEVEAMEKLTAKAKAKFTKENQAVQSGENPSVTAAKLPSQAPAPQPEKTAESASPSRTTDQELPKTNSYMLLKVEPGASFREIHISFLRLVRRLLFEFNQAPKKKRKGMIKDLQQIWIAHDILSDPLTRTDYDIRFLGLKTPMAGTMEGATESGGMLFRVGELLECAGLLEPTELEIAADMHKAMPEMLFGTFLVKQGFITEGDLDQAVLGQELVKEALIPLDVFKEAMNGWLTAQTPIKDYLVNQNIIAKEEMDRIIAKNLQEIQVHKEAKAQQVKSGAAGKIQAVSSGPMINTEEAAKRHISKGHAIPGWKDQLDWSQPEEEEEIKFQFAVREEKEYARPDIEDIVADPNKQKSGKKSLRSLMDGIHAPELAEEPKAKPRKTIADLMGPLVDEELAKPKTVDEMASLQQLLEPEEIKVIETLESIDSVSDSALNESLRDTSDSLKRPIAPQVEKYSEITADKPLPEMSDSMPVRTWMEEESGLGFGFDEQNYDEEEDVEFSFDFGRSDEDEPVAPVRFWQEEQVEEDIINDFADVPPPQENVAPAIVVPAEAEFPQEQDELWEYVEETQAQEEKSDTDESIAAEEVRSEFLEDSDADEMVEVEIMLEADVVEEKDLDPTGTKTREFELELAVDEERSQTVGTISSWSIEPYKAPVTAPAQAIQALKEEDISPVSPPPPQTRSRNLEETAAISTEVARRAVAELNMNATAVEPAPPSRDMTGELSEAAFGKPEESSKPKSKVTPWISEKKEEDTFSVHFVQADEESTVEDLEPVVIAEPGAEKAETAPGAGATPATTPGNEETSEWQLVYKISGSLADALMSDDDDETDMSNLAPKLDDVNVFVTPSQFSGPPISDEWDRIEEKNESSKEIISNDEEDS